MPFGPFARAASLGAVLLVVTAIYLPGLSGGFVLDDHAQIVRNPTLLAATLAPQDLAATAGALQYGALHDPLPVFRRPLSMLSFGLNAALSGMNATAFKLTNLVVHLANAVLVYALVRVLLRAPVLPRWPLAHRHACALFVCALWALHPINLHPVLYVVQRMTSLSALFVLAGAVFYLHTRLAINAGRGGWMRVVLGTLVAGVLAVASKENGLLLIAFLGVVEATLFRFRKRDGALSRPALMFFGLLLVLPALGGLAVLAAHPGYLEAGYSARPFSALERLLTEARVLWRYLFQIALPVPSSFGLFHDDLTVSSGPFTPWTTAVALLGFVGLTVVAWLERVRRPLVGFAVGWFIAGHLIESTVLPLELVFEHRNYIAALGPLVAAVTGLAALSERAGMQGIRMPLAAGLIVVVGIACLFRVFEWRTPLDLALAEVAHRPQSARAQTELGTLYYQLYEATGDARHRANAEQHLTRAVAADPGTTAPVVGLVMIKLLHGESPPAALRRDLVQRCAEGPVQTATVTAVQFLVRCIVDGRCDDDRTLLRDLLEAVVVNPRMSDQTRAMLHLEAARYRARVSGDPAAAASAAAAAVALAPRVAAYHAVLIELLLDAGDAAAAAAALAAAREALGHTALPPRLAELDARVAAARESVSPPRASP